MKRLRKLLAMTLMLFVSMAAAARGESALDGFDPIANGFADSNPEKQPSPDRNNFPGSTTDLDDSDGGLDDFNTDTSTRNYRDTPLFSVTGLDAVTVRALGVFSVLLIPIHCFYCLRDHICERAPPRLGMKL